MGAGCGVCRLACSVQALQRLQLCQRSAEVQVLLAETGGQRFHGHAALPFPAHPAGFALV